MRIVSIGAVVLSATLLAACAAPVLNINEASVTAVTNKPPTPEQVRAAILRAGAPLGWVMKDAGPGKLSAVLALRTHLAEIEIPYSSRSYSLVYKSSVGLREGNGTIHPNYNGWVQNLNKSISAQLAAS